MARQLRRNYRFSKSAIDIHGNDSHKLGDLHRSNAEEWTQLQYDLTSEQTTIKPEPLCDQSYPCMSALHDKASDGTVAAICKPIVITNHDNVCVADNMQRPQSEELDHKACSILMSAKEEYFDNMPTLNIKQKNEDNYRAIMTKPATSNDDMANVATELNPTILNPHQNKI